MAGTGEDALVVADGLWLGLRSSGLLSCDFTAEERALLKSALIAAFLLGSANMARVLTGDPPTLVEALQGKGQDKKSEGA